MARQSQYLALKQNTKIFSYLGKGREEEHMHPIWKVDVRHVFEGLKYSRIWYYICYCGQQKSLKIFSIIHLQRYFAILISSCDIFLCLLLQNIFDTKVVVLLNKKYTNFSHTFSTGLPAGSFSSPPNKTEFGIISRIIIL